VGLGDAGGRPPGGRWSLPRRTGAQPIGDGDATVRIGAGSEVEAGKNRRSRAAEDEERNDADAELRRPGRRNTQGVLGS